MQNKKQLTVVILSVALLQIMASSILSPTLSKTAADFSGINLLLVKMIMTLPSVCIIIVGLMISRLNNRFSKHSLLIIGLVLYVIGGVGGGFAANIEQLLVYRVVLGVGLGLITPLVPIFIVAFYSGTDRTKMMGYSQASNFMGGVIGTVAAGALATISWRYAYGVYIIGLIVLVISIGGLKERKVSLAPVVNDKTSQVKYKLPGKAYLLMILMMLNMFAFFTVPLNMSMYLPTIDIKNTAFVGYAVGVLYFANFLPGTALTKLWGTFREFTIPIALACLCLGFVCLGFANSFVIVVIGMFLMGIGSGTIVPSIFAKVPEVVKSSGIPMAMSLINIGIYLGMFLSMFLTPLTTAIGAAFNNDTLLFSFQLLAVLECAAMIVAIIMAVASKGKEKKVIVK